jgi:hypothetical protein
MDTLLENPNELQEPIHMQRLERFVVIMYSKNSGCETVNAARRAMLTYNLRCLETIPPIESSIVPTCQEDSACGNIYLSLIIGKDTDSAGSCTIWLGVERTIKDVVPLLD